MTTCPEKSRVNTSSYQFYGIVEVFIKKDFMMSFSSVFFRISSPSAKKWGGGGKEFSS
jgi:hypothetical protein